MQNWRHENLCITTNTTSFSGSDYLKMIVCRLLPHNPPQDQKQATSYVSVTRSHVHINYLHQNMAPCVVLQRSTAEAAVTPGCRDSGGAAAIAFNTVTSWPSFASRPLNLWEKGPSHVSTITSGLGTNPAVSVSAQCFSCCFLFLIASINLLFCLDSFPIAYKLKLFPSCLSSCVPSSLQSHVSSTSRLHQGPYCPQTTQRSMGTTWTVCG